MGTWLFKNKNNMPLSSDLGNLKNKFRIIYSELYYNKQYHIYLYILCGIIGVKDFLNIDTVLIL